MRQRPSEFSGSLLEIQKYIRLSSQSFTNLDSEYPHSWRATF
jgi:hypothetical protein